MADFQKALKAQLQATSLASYTTPTPAASAASSSSSSSLKAGGGGGSAGGGGVEVVFLSIHQLHDVDALQVPPYLPSPYLAPLLGPYLGPYLDPLSSPYLAPLLGLVGSDLAWPLSLRCTGSDTFGHVRIHIINVIPPSPPRRRRKPTWS